MRTALKLAREVEEAKSLAIWLVFLNTVLRELFIN
jgi:hypothetical protein